MKVYIENPTDSAKKLLNLINEFGKKVGYKVNIQKSKDFFTPTMKDENQKSRKKNSFCSSNKKNKIPRNKPYQDGERPVLRKLHNTEESNEGRQK